MTYEVSDTIEFSTDYDGLNYLVIYGRHINGGFCCIPNWKVSCEMGSYDSVGYNTDKLSEILCNEKTAKHIAKQIAILAKDRKKERNEETTKMSSAEEPERVVVYDLCHATAEIHIGEEEYICPGCTFIPSSRRGSGDIFDETIEHYNTLEEALAVLSTKKSYISEMSGWGRKYYDVDEWAVVTRIYEKDSDGELEFFEEVNLEEFSDMVISVVENETEKILAQFDNYSDAQAFGISCDSEFGTQLSFNDELIKKEKEHETDNCGKAQRSTDDSARSGRNR